jgi:hypothetical protein
MFSPPLAGSHEDVERRAHGDARLGARGERPHQRICSECQSSKGSDRNENALSRFCACSLRHTI